jgi:hypothetical protein
MVLLSSRTAFEETQSMSGDYSSRLSITVLFLALAVVACSSSSTKSSPDAQPDVNSATDASIVDPLDSAGLDASGESQGEASQASQLTVSPTSIDVGIILPAVPSTRRAITVTATSDLSDLNVFLLGDGLTLDSTSTCGKTLAANTSCIVAITFLSPTLGAKSASVAIVAGGQSTVVPVTAKVLAATHLTIDHTAQAFPSCLGQPMGPYLFQVTNAGDTDVGPVTVKITPADATDFTATATGCDLIAPGSACTISVVFTASTVGTKTASLVVTGPAPDFWTASVLLVGGGSMPNPFSLTPGTYDLGSVAVGTTGPSVTYTLLYSGTACSGAADIIGPFTVTLSSTEFVITDDTCSTSVVPTGGTCTLSVALRPTSTGGKDALLSLTSTSQNPPVIVLTGIGISEIDAGLVEPMDSGLEQRESGNIAIDGSSE